MENLGGGGGEGLLRNVLGGYTCNSRVSKAAPCFRKNLYLKWYPMLETGHFYPILAVDYYLIWKFHAFEISYPVLGIASKMDT